jgi:hypothetical protein
MKLLIEQIGVGIFTSIIYLLLLPFKLEYFVLLFLYGFFKHLFGYYLGIQTFFCNQRLPGTKSVVPFPQLILECILEGLLFLSFGTLLVKCGLNRFIVPYIIAFSIHIIVELTGLHKLFLQHRCKPA